MRTFVIALVLVGSALPAGLPEGVGHWSSGELQGFEKKLGPKMSAQKIATQSLAGYGNHSFLIAHREGDGEAEWHETQNDVMVIESGEATLVVGGTVMDPRTTAPHEIRGPSIRGGEKWRWPPATWCTFRSRRRTRCWWRAASRSRISW
jgi:hypothetical protein